jgi:hypothetical protein
MAGFDDCYWFTCETTSLVLFLSSWPSDLNTKLRSVSQLSKKDPPPWSYNHHHYHLSFTLSLQVHVIAIRLLLMYLQDKDSLVTWHISRTTNFGVASRILVDVTRHVGQLLLLKLQIF